MAFSGGAAIIRNHKRLVISVFFLILVLPGFLFSEDFSAETNFSVNPVRKGYNFKLTIIIDHENTSDISITEPKLPANIQKRAGPAIRPYRDTTGNKEAVNKISITYTLRGLKTGKFRIGSFIINSPEDRYISSEKLISVGVLRNNAVYVPMEPQWILPSGQVFAGEAVPLLLEVKDQDEIILFDSVKTTAPNGGVFERVFGLGEIRMERIGDDLLYNLPADAYIFTPAGPGRVSIPAASVEWNGITAKSRAVSLIIEPVPADVSFTGAVGDFKIDSRVEDVKAAAGEEIVLHVKVSGSGNLNFLHIPEPYCEGGSLLSSVENNAYTASAEGYQGSRENIYSFISDSATDVSVIVPPFPWYSKKTGEVHTEPEKRITVSIMVPSSGENPADEKLMVEIPPESAESISGGRSSYLHSEAVFYMLMLPGLLVFLIFLFIKRIKRRNVILALILFSAFFYGLNGEEGNASRGLAAYNDGRFTEAVQSFEFSLKDHPGNSAVLFNLALSHYKADKHVEALHALRGAVYYDPMNQEYRRLLSEVEMELGLGRQISPALPLHPDLFFILLIIFVNLSLIFGGILLVRKKSGIVIILVMSIFFTVLSGSGLLYTLISRDVKAGIIGVRGTEIKKVPREVSVMWMPLSPGISVKVLGSSNGYLLIETENRLKGWTSEDSILFDSDYFN